MRATRSILIIAAAFLVLPAERAAAQDAQARLWDSAVAGDTAAIRKAVADGAKIDSLDTRRSQSGRMALNWAAWGNHADAVKVLLELKAPLEAENRTGFTALNHAAESGALEAAKILLAAGANPDHGNAQGMTPETVADLKGHYDLAKLLREAPRKKK